MTTQTPAVHSCIECDALVVGAGPVGLFMVFQLGLQGIRAHLVDALPQPGGQPHMLYPDKPIYDLPGIPVCTGTELTQRLLQQIRPFTPVLHMGHVLTEFSLQADGRFLLASDRGQHWLARTLFLAAGVGAFVPKRLPLPELLALDGKQVFHHPSESEWLAACRQAAHVVVAGGDACALACVQQLVHARASLGHNAPPVTLVHRRHVLQGSDAELAAFEQACAQGQARLLVGQFNACRLVNSKLVALTVTTPEGTLVDVPTDVLGVLHGIGPKLGTLSQWGLDMARKQLVVDPASFEASLPGVFAVGDINTYPGKKKLLVCGFHECVLAAFAATQRLLPGQDIHLQYTTTSPTLHQRLGVSPDTSATTISPAQS